MQIQSKLQNLELNFSSNNLGSNEDNLKFLLVSKKKLLNLSHLKLNLTANNIG